MDATPEMIAEQIGYTFDAILATCCACGIVTIDNVVAPRCPYHPYRGLCASCAVQPGEFPATAEEAVVA